jgi:7-keto-8-aminopelargonate synthetase-like enzyme
MKDGLMDFEKGMMAINATAPYNITLQTTDDTPIVPGDIHINGRRMKFFGNCDYMGLQDDPRIKEAAIDAIRNYGLMQCNSRAYVSSHFYGILEEKMTQMMGAPTAVLRTTTYANMSAITLMVDSKDAIVVDQLVHNSVQMSAGMAALQGTKIEKIKHNDMVALEERIIELSKKYQRIWYLFDGVYSTNGDYAPHEAIKSLLDKYDQFYCYCDEAWGLSWTGKNGTGVTLEKMGLHPKMILVTSLEKGFGAGGAAAVVIPDEFRLKVVKFMSPVQVFSGPATNTVLAAACTSADIHLSDEIYTMQNDFKERVLLAQSTAKSLKLPLDHELMSPVMYVKVGDSAKTFYIAGELVKAGFFCNASAYPSIPNKLSGIRIIINRYVSHEDIKHLFIALSEIYAQADTLFGETDISATLQYTKTLDSFVHR